MAKRKGPTATQSTEPIRDTAPDIESRSMGSEPSEEDIRARAYQRYLARGCGDGQECEDWYEAERELRNKVSS